MRRIVNDLHISHISIERLMCRSFGRRLQPSGLFPLCVGGDETVARAGLRHENSALGGKPIENIQTVSGLTHVIAYLETRRAVV